MGRFDDFEIDKLILCAHNRVITLIEGVMLDISLDCAQFLQVFDVAKQIKLNINTLLLCLAHYDCAVIGANEAQQCLQLVLSLTQNKSVILEEIWVFVGFDLNLNVLFQ